ncbi:protein of unknown function [Acidithiobacillus ferrivorans]|uniref:Uncharacterized protein n=1 Tax=Acidithiobacillus ferrivorans TaxID=160808 RepID=A0A060URY0_9PROT|nr:hypothetical protein AFERRI_50011 [Acidithiobacillus ferrivorans]SMH64983.1 protein of unknown function [Acidithiobacillus ferrivorans]
MKYLPFVCLYVFRQYTTYNFSRIKKWYPHLNRERSMLACGRGLFSYCFRLRGILSRPCVRKKKLHLCI